MSLKANIEIALNFNRIKIRRLFKQGYTRYRLCLYYIHPGTKQIVFCHPYNIIKNQSSELYKSMYESEIDESSEYYYSPITSIKYVENDYQQNQTCSFKVYIQTEYLTQVQLICSANLFFSQSQKSLNELIQVDIKEIGMFEAQINKLYSIGTYLPIIFDNIGCFEIIGTYHATIIQFKFQKLLFQSQRKVNYYDFWSYVEAVTQGFKPDKTKQFYEYYRDFIEHQYQSIQERHSQFINIIHKNKRSSLHKHQGIKLSLTHHAYTDNNSQYNFSTLPINKELLNIIKQLQKKKSFYAASESIQNSIVDKMLEDFTEIKAKLYEKWNQYIGYVHKHSDSISKYLQINYLQKVKQRFYNNIFSHQIKNHDYTFSKYEDSGKSHLQHAGKEKLKYEYNIEVWKEIFPVFNANFLGNDKKNIKMFQEVFLVNKQHQLSFSIVGDSRKTTQQKKLTHFLGGSKVMHNQHKKQVIQHPIHHLKGQKKIKHIIFLVHGFHASKAEFTALKSALLIYYNVEVVSSTCNEGRTDDSLESLGKRFAIQVTNYLAPITKQYRVSFIGHSMGGIIIRSALTYLQDIQDKLHSFISICTPHLGYVYRTSTLVGVGLWMLNNWATCTSISQLCMNDAINPKQTFLYKLSKNEGLNNFKHIALISSSQDEYVSYQSARIQKNMKLFNSSLQLDKSALICELVDNLLRNIKAKQISRVDVVFDIQKTNIDSFLGRSGHILFLTDIQFVKEFVICFNKFFE